MKRSGYSKLLYNQRNKNETILSSDKTTVWGAHYIKISENTEQRIIIIQMHSIQHPQIDQSHYNIPSFLLSPVKPI